MDTLAVALAEEVAEIQKELARPRAVLVRSHYRIGQITNRIRADARYGEAAVAALARETGLKARYLYEVGKVAAAFSAEQIKSLFPFTSHAPGHAVSLAHLLHLARVQDEARRAGLLALASSEGWSVRATARNVCEVVDAGRTPEEPGQKVALSPAPVRANATSSAKKNASLSSNDSAGASRWETLMMKEVLRGMVTSSFAKLEALPATVDLVERLAAGATQLLLAAENAKQLAARLQDIHASKTRELEEQRQVDEFDVDFEVDGAGPQVDAGLPN